MKLQLRINIPTQGALYLLEDPHVAPSCHVLQRVGPLAEHCPLLEPLWPSGAVSQPLLPHQQVQGLGWHSHRCPQDSWPADQLGQAGYQPSFSYFQNLRHLTFVDMSVAVIEVQNYTVDVCAQNCKM